MIYLDSAATSLIKPACVEMAVLHAMRSMASPGRGGHEPAMKAAETVYACREAAAALFHAPDPSRVVFPMNATHGLNLAIHSLVKPGSRVLISGFEHNAVTRPLHALGAEIRIAGRRLFDPEELLKEWESLLPGTDAAICTQVSNVFGYILPVGEIARLCREAGVPLIVDASQAAGVLPVDMTGWGAAFVAMPGHKGLLGPMGTGLLCLGDGVLPRPLREGGTGSASESLRQPAMLPDRLESGTANLPGIAGLCQGLKFVLRHRAAIAEYEHALALSLRRELQNIRGVTVYCAGEEIPQAAVVSFNIQGLDSGAAADALNREKIAVRGGLHCAPSIHAWLGTEGAVRASFGPFNTEKDVEMLLSAVEKLAKDAPPPP